MKYLYYSMVLLVFASCSNDNSSNICNFQNLNITESAKNPLTPESTTAVWNWKISNDTLKVQTLNYLYDVNSPRCQTYFFKIKPKNCIEPLYCKHFIFTDVINGQIHIFKADIDVTIESYVPNEELKFRVNSFSNITNNGQPTTQNVFFKSPNDNQDIWVMLNNNYVDTVYGGYNSEAE